jgi:hypothetical protein
MVSDVSDAYVYSIMDGPDLSWKWRGKRQKLEMRPPWKTRRYRREWTCSFSQPRFDIKFLSFCLARISFNFLSPAILDN